MGRRDARPEPMVPTAMLPILTRRLGCMPARATACCSGSSGHRARHGHRIVAAVDVWTSPVTATGPSESVKPGAADLIERRVRSAENARPGN